MAIFAVLRHDEAVSVDVDCLVQIYASAGDDGAEEIIVRTVDEIGDALSQIGRLADEGNFPKLNLAALRVAMLAQTIGLSALSDVACDVAETSVHGDMAGLAATLARLFRVAQTALATVWELHQAVR